MSREQWGHGYWKGRKDEQKNPEGPRYIGLYNEKYDPPILGNCGLIHEKHGDALVVEWIDIWDMAVAVDFGYEPNNGPIEIEACEQIRVDEIKSAYKLFYSWSAIANEFIKACKAMDKRYRRII